MIAASSNFPTLNDLEGKTNVIFENLSRFTFRGTSSSLLPGFWTGQPVGCRSGMRSQGQKWLARAARLTCLAAAACSNVKRRVGMGAKLLNRALLKIGSCLSHHWFTLKRSIAKRCVQKREFMRTQLARKRPLCSPAHRSLAAGLANLSG